MERKIVALESTYMTLGQLLKHLNIISSGGMAKAYLSQYYVYVNDIEEQRRGKKLYAGDVIELPHEELLVEMVKIE